MSSPYQLCAGEFKRERNGLVSISPVWLVPGPASPNDPEPYDVLDSFSPASKPLDLPEVDRSATKRQDGDWELTIHFEGAVSGRALNPVFEYDFAKNESPLQLFPRFDKLVETFKGKVVTTDEGGVEFNGFAYKIEDPTTGQKTKNRLFGVTHFRDAAVQLIVEFGLKEFSPTIIRDINKIVTPEVPEGTAQFVETPEGMNWLKAGVSASYRGNIYLIKVTYELGIWIPEIYAAEAA